MYLTTILWLLGWLFFLGGVGCAIGNLRRKLSLVVAAVAFFFATLIGAARVIPAGHVGVRTTFGQVHDKVLQPGLNWVTPFIDSVVTMETRMKTWPVDSPPCKSKDLQLVHAVISVQHCLEGEWAPQAYRTVGDLSKFDVVVVAPAVFEATKAVIGRYAVSELIRNREEVKAKIEHAIQENIDRTLEEKGVKGALKIANVSIQDFDFSEEFNRSIEATMTAQQDALQAESDRQRSVILAEADAKARQLLAEGDAYAINAKSVAQSAAIDREAKALAKGADVLLKYRYINQWNGELPRFIGGAVPLTNVETFSKPSGK